MSCNSPPSFRLLEGESPNIVNDLIAIPRFACVGKQSFSSNTQKRERGGKREPQFSTIN